MNKIWLVLVVIFGLLLIACGDSGSGTNTTSEGEKGQNDWGDADGVVKGVCNIHVCDKSSEGERLYVLANQKTYQCKSGIWKDAAGKTFDELEFVGCFMDALVQDTVESADDLKNCTENKEGDIFVVGKNMVACYAKSWVGIPGSVVSEGDLPDCSGNGYIYVMGKMAVYQCKEGVWYGNGKAVKQASTDVPKSSSSQTMSQESSPSSSDKTSSSSKDVEDDGTKVRGVCQVSKSAVEKGESVTYSFYNMGGTIVSYTWNFGEKASTATSDASSPEVSFSAGGTYRAKLVVNAGRDSESDEIVCPGVHVLGTPITGCECSTETPSLMLKKNGEVSATWSVSGCEGGAPFTYEWAADVAANGTSGTMTVTEEGSMQPTVTVTNDDGQSMEPVCNAVPVTEEMSVECNFSRWGDGGSLSLPSIKNGPKTEKFSLYLVGSEGDEQEIKVEGYCYSDQCQHWFGSVPITYNSPRYDLMYDDLVLCSYITVTGCSCGEGTLISTSKELSEVNPVQYRWTVSGCQDHGAGELSYSWNGDNYEADEENPKVAVGSFTERGRYYPSVTVTNPLGYSMTAYCDRASVTEAPYVETDLEYENVLLVGSYAIYSYEGGSTWLTWAEEGEEIPSDLEDWFEEGLVSIKEVEKKCGGVTRQAHEIKVSYPVLLTVPENKSLTLHECVVVEDDDE